MKKSLITLWIILLSISLHAQLNVDTLRLFISPIHKSCVGHIVSHEHLTLSTNFQINAKCYFLDTASVDGLLWQLPQGWSITNSYTTPLAGNPGDSLLLSFMLSIPDIVNLPFYPQYIMKLFL